MEKPEHHIFVCMSFRGLEPKGKCIKKNAPELLGYLESELADRGLDNVMVSSTGCIPKERDFILIPSVTDASGEATTTDPQSVTLRMAVLWENGDEAPETSVTVDSRVSVEDDVTQDFLGRVQLQRTTDFDGTLAQGESISVRYEGTQSPLVELESAIICDGRPVHLQVLYSTQGGLADARQTALSNAFSFVCD